MASEINQSSITNISEYPNAFKRQTTAPLDITSAWQSTSSMTEYASGGGTYGPTAYVGQILTCKNGTSEVDTYVINNTTTPELLTRLVKESEFNTHKSTGGTPSVTGHVILYAEDDCSLHTSDDGALTPAAAKVSISSSSQGNITCTQGIRSVCDLTIPNLGTSGTPTFNKIIINSSVLNGTWISGVNNAAITLNTAASGGSQTSWISQKDSSGGAFTLGTLASSNSLYFSYFTKDSVDSGTNTTKNQLTWNGDTGNLSATTFTAMSDKRLKENIVPYTLTKNSVLDLPIYKFDFINNGSKNNIGCLAQDLQKICPEIVHKDKDGYLSIEESKIVYLLLNEVKQLRKELDELKGTL